ncbi:unnamed protein product, partial [Heterotrigona itama]
GENETRIKDKSIIPDSIVRIYIYYFDSVQRRQGTKTRTSPTEQTCSPIVSDKSRLCSNRPWSFAPQDEPKGHVIRLGDRSGESVNCPLTKFLKSLFETTGRVGHSFALQISDNRRKRETHENCKKDSDCTKGQVCIWYA